MNDKRIAELADLLKKHSLSEIELEENGTRIRLVAGGRAPIQAFAHLHEHPYPPPPQRVCKTELSLCSGHHTRREIKSPFVGTYYASSSPENPPYAKVGDRIRKGQVLCIVEAMKIMNEIEAETDGVIAEILVQNQDPVEFGQPLFVLS